MASHHTGRSYHAQRPLEQAEAKTEDTCREGDNNDDPASMRNTAQESGFVHPHHIAKKLRRMFIGYKQTIYETSTVDAKLK